MKIYGIPQRIRIGPQELTEHLAMHSHHHVCGDNGKAAGGESAAFREFDICFSVHIDLFFRGQK